MSCASSENWAHFETNEILLQYTTTKITITDLTKQTLSYMSGISSFHLQMGENSNLWVNYSNKL